MANGVELWCCFYYFNLQMSILSEMSVNTLDIYHLMITSKYFESIEDFINLEMAVKRFNGNMDRFHFNPISLNVKTRKFFSNLETLHLFNKNEQKFKDRRIFKCCIWYRVNYERYLKEKGKGNVCKLIFYSREDKPKYGNEIPNEIKILGDCFFFKTQMKSIELPFSLISIEDGCFKGLTSTTLVDIPSTVTSFGKECFCCCSSLLSINIPPSIKSFGNYCFFNCCVLTSMRLPSTLTMIGKNCFQKCSSLKEITIPCSISKLQRGCFCGCSSLTSIVIPTSIKKFGRDCFYGCTSLQHLVIPTSVTSIGSVCFGRCVSLKSITIPSSIKNIGKTCFYKCDLLKIQPNILNEYF